MAQILAFLLYFVLLAVAVATGAFLLIALAAAATVFAIYLYVRARLTGKPVGFTRVYSVHSFGERPAPPDNVVDVEYREIGGDKR